MLANRQNDLLCGAIEAGGTKWVCAVGTGPDDLRAETRFTTTTPSETIGRAVAFLHEYQQTETEALAAVGVGSFGPINLDPHSFSYGTITSTPKPGWAETNLVGELQRVLSLPIAIDTDVNAAALGEYRWGAAQGCAIAVYLTIGTGIGGGAIINGQLVHGVLHPEMGHIRISRDPVRDAFGGVCPFHGDCLEGLASGPALALRWGQPAEQLPSDHQAWPLQAHYLAQAICNIICILSPQRIVLGGGVAAQPTLLGLVRRETQLLLNGYIRAAALREHIDEYIVTPGLGNRSGILGALALAQDHAQTH